MQKAQGGLIDRYNIDKYKLYHFLKDVQESYNADVPYHNAKHATDILQAAYYSLNKSKYCFLALLFYGDYELSVILELLDNK